MTSLAPSSMPCIRCHDRLVKFGGITGMCIACRAADPVMAQERRDLHAAMKVEMAIWVQKNLEDIPGKPGLMRPKKGSRLF